MFPGRWNVLLARIDYMRHYHDFLSKLYIEEVTEIEQWPDTFSSLVHNSLQAHCSYRLRSLLFKITWRVIFTTTVFLALVLLDHIQHDRLSTQGVWHCACTDALPSRSQRLSDVESASKKNTLASVIVYVIPLRFNSSKNLVPSVLPILSALSVTFVPTSNNAPLLTRPLLWDY